MIRFDKNGNMFKEPSPISLVGSFIIAAMIYVFIVFIGLGWRLDKMEKKFDTVYQRYDDLVYENEILWTYVENIDTFKTLEDAIQARDDVYDMIQFIDE